MKIAEIKIYSVRIPFSFSVNHNLKNRAHSESVVLEISTTDGKKGYGEGAPRAYVTGETMPGIIQTFTSALQDKPIPPIYSLADITQFCADLHQQYQMPSIVAALEVALLDLFGQYQSCSIGHFFQADSTYLSRYSGVLPYMDERKTIKLLNVIQSLELSHIKIKVGHQDDLKRLALTRSILGEQIDIRVDANRAWTLDEAVSQINALEQFNISCVEEPLQNSHLASLPELSKRIKTPILLDESVYTLNQAKYYINKIASEKLLLNLKLSKSGGLFLTSQIHQYAMKNGIGCQLGCNVGETAILSAAGRIFAQTHELKYLEGSFAPFFMQDDLGQEAVAFKKTGVADLLDGDGLGIKINTTKLEKYGTHVTTC